jgi:hypothetical protein
MRSRAKATAQCCDVHATVQIHVLVLRLSVAADVRLMTMLLDSYAKCSDLASAQMVFDEVSANGDLNLAVFVNPDLNLA